MERFTRPETVILTRTSPSRLAYLAKIGLVVPHRSDTGTPRLYYSWEQILELRTINALRQKTSLQTIRKILSFLDHHGSDRRLCNKHLIVTADGVSWVRRPPQPHPLPEVVQIVGHASRRQRHVGQLQLLPLSPAPQGFKDSPSKTTVVSLSRFKQQGRSPSS
jgi:DNA-binding transcriptional MerR regulator